MHRADRRTIHPFRSAGPCRGNESAARAPAKTSALTPDPPGKAACGACVAPVAPARDDRSDGTKERARAVMAARDRSRILTPSSPSGRTGTSPIPPKAGLGRGDNRAKQCPDFVGRSAKIQAHTLFSTSAVRRWTARQAAGPSIWGSLVKGKQTPKLPCALRAGQGPRRRRCVRSPAVPVSTISETNS